ncbi:hypothetical protein, partial [Paenibacillus woosongensis]|uniref:hypothetical protein n=1 Tax=Paenibacillus woosongensis TaxID=307580 RepID=UPI001E2EE89C
TFGGGKPPKKKYKHFNLFFSLPFLFFKKLKIGFHFPPPPLLFFKVFFFFLNFFLKYKFFFIKKKKKKKKYLLNF